MLAADLLLELPHLGREELDRPAALRAHHVMVAAPVVLVLEARHPIVEGDFTRQAAVGEVPDQTLLLLADEPLEGGLSGPQGEDLDRFPPVGPRKVRVAHRFESVQKVVSVAESGTTPDLESLKIEMKPRDEVKRAVEDARQANQEQRIPSFEQESD